MIKLLKTINDCFKVLTKKRSKLLKPYLIDLRKRSVLITSLPSTRRLVFGSSHAYYGWFAQEGEFNCANSSCDLYHAFKLYEKIVDSSSKKDFDVVLFYSVFSRGFILEKTSEGVFSIPYKLLWGIGYQYPLLLAHRLIEWRVAKKLEKMEAPVEENYLGNCEYFVKKGKIAPSAASRVSSHLKNNARAISQDVFVKNLSQAVRRNGGKFCVVIPPVRKDYADLLPRPVEKLFVDLLDIAAEEHFQVLDYTLSNDFTEDDFVDTDHLNERGAKKLSDKVRKVL